MKQLLVFSEETRSLWTVFSTCIWIIVIWIGVNFLPEKQMIYIRFVPYRIQLRFRCIRETSGCFSINVLQRRLKKKKQNSEKEIKRHLFTFVRSFLKVSPPVEDQMIKIPNSCPKFINQTIFRNLLQVAVCSLRFCNIKFLGNERFSDKNYGKRRKDLF